MLGGPEAVWRVCVFLLETESLVSVRVKVDVFFYVCWPFCWAGDVS